MVVEIFGFKLFRIFFQLENFGLIGVFYFEYKIRKIILKEFFNGFFQIFNTIARFCRNDDSVFITKRKIAYIIAFIVNFYDR